MDLKDLKVALADLYLMNIEKAERIAQLTKAGDQMAKELQAKAKKKTK